MAPYDEWDRRINSAVICIIIKNMVIYNIYNQYLSMSELYTVQKMYEAFEGKSLQESEKGNPFVQINTESFSSSYVFKTELQRKQYLVSMTGQGLNDAIAWLEKG